LGFRLCCKNPPKNPPIYRGRIQRKRPPREERPFDYIHDAPTSTGSCRLKLGLGPCIYLFRQFCFRINRAEPDTFAFEFPRLLFNYLRNAPADSRL